jgi:hypothetical protein
MAVVFSFGFPLNFSFFFSFSAYDGHKSSVVKCPRQTPTKAFGSTSVSPERAIHCGLLFIKIYIRLFWIFMRNKLRNFSKPNAME